MKRTLGPLERIFPMPCVILGAGPVTEPSLMTASWINVVATAPPTIAVGVRKIRHTLKAMEESSCFSINIPSTALADTVDYLGIATANNPDIDKAHASKLHFSPGAVLDVPLVDECPYNLECRVTQTLDLGVYTLILAEIEQTHAEERILVAPDSDVVDIEALDPLIYIAGAREYRAIGSAVGPAYTIGKRFIG